MCFFSTWQWPLANARNELKPTMRRMTLSRLEENRLLVLHFARHTCQMARARLLYGDHHGARQSYKEFLDLWKDADPDNPILIQAREESAKSR